MPPLQKDTLHAENTKFPMYLQNGTFQCFYMNVLILANMDNRRDSSLFYYPCRQL